MNTAKGKHTSDQMMSGYHVLDISKDVNGDSTPSFVQ